MQWKLYLIVFVRMYNTNNASSTETDCMWTRHKLSFLISLRLNHVDIIVRIIFDTNLDITNDIYMYIHQRWEIKKRRKISWEWYYYEIILLSERTVIEFKVLKFYLWFYYCQQVSLIVGIYLSFFDTHTSNIL